MSATSESKLRVTLIKSPVGYSERQKRTVRALGLRRMHQTVEHTDSAVVRGMIAKVSHLVRVESTQVESGKVESSKVEGGHEAA